MFFSRCGFFQFQSGLYWTLTDAAVKRVATGFFRMFYRRPLGLVRQASSGTNTRGATKHEKKERNWVKTKEKTQKRNELVCARAPAGRRSRGIRALRTPTERNHDRQTGPSLGSCSLTGSTLARAGERQPAWRSAQRGSTLAFHVFETSAALPADVQVGAHLVE